MVVSGLPERTPFHAGNVASLGLDLLGAVKNFRYNLQMNAYCIAMRGGLKGSCKGKRKVMDNQVRKERELKGKGNENFEGKEVKI